MVSSCESNAKDICKIIKYRGVDIRICQYKNNKECAEVRSGDGWQKESCYRKTD